MAIKISNVTVIDDSKNWTGNTIEVSAGGTGLTSPGTTGNLLTSNGTHWISQTLVVPPAAVGGLTAFGSVY